MKHLKSCLLLAGLLWVSNRAVAAPAAPANPLEKDAKVSVTQISLLTADGFAPRDRIIFNQDGTASRTTGVGTDNPRIDEGPEKTIQLKGQIPALQFKRLVALIESIEYFKLERVYTSYDWTPSYFIEVAKGEEKKSIAVRDGNRFGGGHTPIGLWGLNMAIRGIAADIKWEKAEVKPGNKNITQ